MLLDINEDFKLVYDLSIEIERDPSFMHLVQQVTLDPNKPHVGLKGNFVRRRHRLSDRHVWRILKQADKEAEQENLF